MPFFTVIVPIYKVEDYLSACIDSILTQSFDDYELILVDDGSPDSCPTICDEYAYKDKRITVIHRENGGLSAARNSGLKVARGRYVCLIDSDDFIHPQFLEILHNTFVKSDADICVFKFARFYADDYHIPSYQSVDFKSLNLKEFFNAQLNHEYDMGICNRAFKREIFESVRFKEGKLHEDIIFNGDLLDIEIDNIATIDCELYFYRQRIDSIVNSQVKNKVYSADRVYAGEYIFKKAQINNFPHLDSCLCYAFGYPWSVIDSIYLNFNFKKNKHFVKILKTALSNLREYILANTIWNDIIKKRMILFSKSPVLYVFNVYGRLLRVYLFRLIGKDPYKDGHGI